MPARRAARLTMPHAPTRDSGCPRLLRKHPLVRRAPVERRAEGVQVHRDRPEHAPADRHEPLLAPLPQHPHQPFRQHQVRQPEPADFRDAQPGAIAQLQERAVPPPQRLVDGRRREQRLDLRHRQRVRKRAAEPGALQPVARILLDDPLAEQEPEVGADGGDVPANGRSAEAEVLQREDELPQDRPRQPCRAGEATRVGELRQPAEVAQVVLDGVRAVAGFQGEEVAEPLEPEPARGIRGAHWRSTPSSAAARAIMAASAEVSVPSASATRRMRSTRRCRSSAP